MRIKELIKTTLKLTIGLGLVAYALHSKMVDFRTLEGVLLSPFNIIVAMAFLFATACLVTLRWYLLAKTQGLTLNLGSMFQLTMIGNFFNTFMPGSVGGDLIKAWYIAGREPQKKTKAVISVVVDRLLGLAIFIFYAAITLVFYLPADSTNPKLFWLAISVWSLTGLGVLLCLLYFFSVVSHWKGIDFLRKKMESLGSTQNLLDAARLYRSQRWNVLKAALISAISFTMMILFFKFEGDQLGIHMPLGQYFFVVPLAMVVSAVPLLPGGIGVGQVAFYTLFQWIGNPTPEQGGTLCTLFQIYTILFNCLGAFFYVRFRRIPTQQNPDSTPPKTPSRPFNKYAHV